MQNPQKTAKTRAVTAALLTTAAMSLLASAQAGPTASAGYSISTFGVAPVGATNPDSIAVSGNDVFIGYAGSAGKTGGGTSTIAEYDLSGALLNTFSVSGHNDGLKVDPTGNLWAMQNEDGNPSLAIIDPVSGITLSSFNLKSSNSGGGYDDIVFQNNTVYFSASNAQQDPNTDPAIVKATLNSFGVFQFTPVLEGNATATDGATGLKTTLNLTDADSLTTTPGGALLLTDQTANQLVTVASPGTGNQAVTAVGTSSGGVSLPVDDTIFNALTGGTLLVSDTNSNTIYAIRGPFAGQTFSAAPNNGFVGSLDLNTGVLTPIVTGFTAPKGMGFIAPVPEASTLISFGSGAALLLGFFLKRKRQTAA